MEDDWNVQYSPSFEYLMYSCSWCRIKDYTLSSPWGHLTNMDGEVIAPIIWYGMELLINFQTSKVLLLKFGNG